MSFDIEQERKKFDEFRAWTANHTCGNAVPTFEGWLNNKLTVARYAEFAQRAKSDCPHCKGAGYLPVFLPGDNIAVACPCIDNSPRSSQAPAMMREANKPELHPLPVRFVRAKTRWGRLINWITQEIP